MASKITRSAKMRTCTLRLPDCRNDRETVVFAHLPSIDSGRGFKSPDWWGVYSCSHCHDLLDRRKKHPLVDHRMVAERSLSALYETQKALIDEGLITLT
jgi:hypothetical protein